MPESADMEAGDVRSRVFLLAAYGGVRGHTHGDAREHVQLLRRALALAEESGDPALFVVIAGWGIAFFQIGEYREGLAMLDRAIELAGGDATVGAGIGMACPFAYCHVVKGGFFLATMGELAAARPLIERGRELAHEHGDIESVGWSHGMSAGLDFATGQLDQAVAHAQRAVEITERIGDSYSRAIAWYVLGFTESARGEWRQAIEAIERSREISSEKRTSAFLEGVRLAVLGGSYLGLGELKRAYTLAAEGLEMARGQGNIAWEMIASLALARVLLASDGPAAREKAEAVLARALELTRERGAKALEPHVHVELAELARQLGDEQARKRELREAHRLLTEIGATGHVERLAAELAAAA